MQWNVTVHAHYIVLITYIRSSHIFFLCMICTVWDMAKLRKLLQLWNNHTCQFLRHFYLPYGDRAGKISGIFKSGNTDFNNGVRTEEPSLFSNLWQNKTTLSMANLRWTIILRMRVVTYLNPFHSCNALRRGFAKRSMNWTVCAYHTTVHAPYVP